MNLSLYANIDEEIESIQNATVEERFKLMNKFKKHLIEMKEIERIKAMEKLFATSKNKKVIEEIKKKTLRKNIFLHIEHEMESESASGGEQYAD